MASAKVPIGLTEATPGVTSTSSSSSRPRGKIEVRTQFARHDVGDPGARREPGVLPDAAERHDHREPDREGTDRQRRAASVAQ